ncbi:MAG: hypothetical protein M3Q79_01460 [bacterium]|nr:hypothetical protein [bacterium]
MTIPTQEPTPGFDENFWMFDVASLQIAAGQGVEDWASLDGLHSYRMTTRLYPLNELPSYDLTNDMPSTIPDPEFNLSEGVVPHLGPFVISRIATEDSVVFGTPKPRGVFVPSLVFLVNEEHQSLRIYDNLKAPTVNNKHEIIDEGYKYRSLPSEQDIYDLKYGVQSLKAYLEF